MELHEIAEKLGAEVFVPPGTDSRPIEISTISPITEAKEGSLSFLTNPRFEKHLETCQASAVICAKKNPTLKMPQIIHGNPYAAMAMAAQLFYKRTSSFEGQSSLAYISDAAHVDPTATVYPFAYVEEGAYVGPSATLYPHTYVGPKCRIGEGSVLFPGVVLYEGTEVSSGVTIHGNAVIGGDGFGFAPNGDRVEKIPQVAGVKIGKDVEIGSLSSVDRGALEDTVLEEGAKLDSLVQVAHGAKVGSYSMVCALVGVSGSAKIGKRCTLAGHVGVAPGVKVEDYSTFGAKSGVTKSLPSGGEYLGFPAMPSNEWRRQVASLRKLSGTIKEVNELKQKVAELEAKLTSTP